MDSHTLAQAECRAGSDVHTIRNMITTLRLLDLLANDTALPLSKRIKYNEDALEIQRAINQFIVTGQLPTRDIIQELFECSE